MGGAVRALDATDLAEQRPVVLVHDHHAVLPADEQPVSLAPSGQRRNCPGSSSHVVLRMRGSEHLGPTTGQAPRARISGASSLTC